MLSNCYFSHLHIWLQLYEWLKLNCLSYEIQIYYQKKTQNDKSTFYNVQRLKRSLKVVIHLEEVDF